eukprot:gnl/MRDRNA2_/MRDRNA2_75851_c0_seq3.p1 gnl/MRDRNA2_/MRDRNA2_75851_c0~~gnl/MRDRNA2_/MRDRNA2_75851_c0_seq3.p1  ORF type:complete len:586 (-),score=95.34 gnl/MRDRNA2_/MRDRNA2_75851_c0_seq3:195-1952(-)
MLPLFNVSVQAFPFRNTSRYAKVPQVLLQHQVSIRKTGMPAGEAPGKTDKVHTTAAIGKENTTAKPEPDLVSLMARLGKALAKYQFKYKSTMAMNENQQVLHLDETSEIATAQAVWKSFRETMEDALDDESLHLDTGFDTPRTDGSIFISISSYRDPSCSATVRKAYERAAHPELINVGVVQQNCEAQKGCFTGKGWGETRRWVPQNGPDPDCVSAFCGSPAGRHHCEAGRVRILRLSESLALGPYFSRYLNSKMWRRETYFLQIDSHTDFRSGWDDSLREMIRHTPSYPYSVISTYPPPGTPDDKRPWPGLKDTRWVQRPGLCEASFERAGGSYTLRMLGSSITSNGKETESPPYAAFVAAGFLFAHSSILAAAPPDPFLPYIFMGEEIALSLRLWTSGFDIYAPSADVVGHEYVRADYPKFWETVGMVFSHPGFHNDIQDLVIRRVQHLIGLEEYEEKTLKDQALLIRMEDYTIGKVRSLEDFQRTMGLNMAGKFQNPPAWCLHAQPPPIVQKTKDEEQKDERLKYQKTKRQKDEREKTQGNRMKTKHNRRRQTERDKDKIWQIKGKISHDKKTKCEGHKTRK